MALSSTGISVSMVASEIGAATSDVGKLCTHPNINKWSKWKPISISKVTAVTIEDLISVGFGLLPPASVSDISQAGQGEYSYIRPNGTGAAPYRLGDFRRYDHTALSPMGNVSEKQFNSLVETEYKFQFLISNGNFGDSGGNIGLNEISSVISNCYLCVIIKDTNNNYYWKTANDTIVSGNGFNVTFSSSELPETLTGTYTVCACDKKKLNVSDNVSSPVFWTLPTQSIGGGISTFLLSNVFPLAVSVYGISNQVTASPDDISKYKVLQLPEGQLPPSSSLFHTNSGGAIYIAVSLTNNGSKSVFLNSPLITFQSNKNMTANSGATGWYRAYGYDITDGVNAVAINNDVITINAGDTKKLLLGNTDLLSHYNYSNGTVISQRIEASLSFRYNDKNIFSIPNTIYIQY